MTIPKITHQIWMQGWKNLPEKFQDNVEILHEMNPGYKHMKWDEDSLRSECKKYGEDCLKRFDSFEILMNKVDFGRYVVLYNYGGISVDTDMVSLRPIDDTPLSDHNFLVSEISYPGNLIGLKNSAVVICTKGNSIMKDGVERIIADQRTQKDFYSREEYISSIAGPQFIGKLVEDHRDEVGILSYVYFEPCSPRDPSCTIPEESIMDHQHELSWTSPLYKFLIWLLYFLLNSFNYILISLVFYTLYYVYKKNKRAK